MIIITKKKCRKLLKLIFTRFLEICKERDKYKKLYYENIENTEKLIKCLNDGSYAQVQYAKQREMNVKLLNENKLLKNKITVERFKNGKI